MRLPRFSYERAGLAPRAGDLVTLDPSQSRHAVKVLRLAVGRQVELTGPWGLAQAAVEEIALKPTPSLLCRLTGPFVGAAEARFGSTLALALIRGPRFDWAVEKASELGAAALVPLITERGVPLAGGVAKKNRWERLAQEARKQCGRPYPMAIRQPVSLEDFLREPLEGAKYILEANGAPFPDPTGQPPILMVGPEGGLTDPERQMVLAAGFQPLSLGPVTLRSETAALAALAKFLPS